jgi:hypothetical protein
MFRLYEAPIIRLHVSELYEKESHIAVDVHSENKYYRYSYMISFSISDIGGYRSTILSLQIYTIFFFIQF